jgi:hypothetical protein
MRAAPTGSRRGWAWVAGAGVLVLVGLALLVRVPSPPRPPEPETARSPVGIVDPVAINGSMLFDLTPLFLPTEFNSSRKDYKPREPGSSFAGFPAKRTFADSGLRLRLGPPVAVPDNPAEALVGDPPGAPFLGFGQSDLGVSPLPRRGAYVEIVDAGSGRKVFGQEVAQALPPAAAPWRPMEFVAAVDAAGLVGPLVPTVRSGVVEVDDYFMRFLADTLRVGQRLSPGFYRISVGP